MPAGSSPCSCDDLGDATRVRGRRDEELALLDDALAQLLDAHRVDEPLEPGAELVVAVAVVVLRPAGSPRSWAGGLHATVNSSSACAGCGLAPRPPAMNTLKPGSTRAVGTRAVARDHADVVEHRLAAVGGAAGEVDLELAGEALRDRVAQEEVLGGLGPRRDVEHLVGARAGEVAAVTLRTVSPHASRLVRPTDGEEAEHLGRLSRAARSGTARSGGW